MRPESAPPISRERLASICATATSTVKPRPSESPTVAVGAPGRCRLARARRSSGRRTDPKRRMPAINVQAVNLSTKAAARMPTITWTASPRSVDCKTAKTARPDMATALATKGKCCGRARGGTTSARKRSAGVTAAAAARGPSVTASATRIPEAAASASVRQSTNGSRLSAGMSERRRSARKGATAPNANPRPMPMAAMISPSARKARKTCPDDAPRDLSVAMVARLRLR